MRRERKLSSFGIVAVLWVSAFVVYQTTFIHSPRLFLYPKTGLSFFDVAEHAAALKGSPNEIDMRKHLLYYPVGRLLYRFVNWIRICLKMNLNTVALLFPGALYGATSIALAYLLFLRFMQHKRCAAIAAACYAFMYSMWIGASVTESYMLTVLSVNLFLYFALPEKIELNWRWCCSSAAFIAISSLCDLRSILLLIVPFYIIVGTPGMKGSQRIKYMLFIAGGAIFVVAMAYELARHISGYGGFGICAMFRWLPNYGREFTSLSRTITPRSASQALLTFFVESMSPLYQRGMGGSLAAIRRVQISFAYCFLAILIVVVLGACGNIRKRLKTSLALQALGCWLVVYAIYHIFYSPWSALLFSSPFVLPLSLIVLPGIVSAWMPRRAGVMIISLVIIIMLANNLITINEARLSSQQPAIIQSQADRVYLLPGEIERGQVLVRKSYSMLPERARDKVAELKAKPRGSLTDRDRLELDKLIDQALGCLPKSESTEARDILRRHKEAISLAIGEK